MMRAGKVFSILALSALTLCAFAQVTVIRMAGYDNSRPQWWNQTFEEIAGRVYDSNLESIAVPLYIDLIPNQQWINNNPSPGQWGVFAFTFIYDTRYIDFIVGARPDGSPVRLSELPGTLPDPGEYLVLNVGDYTFIAGGISSGGVFRPDPNRRNIIRLTLVAAATADINGDPDNSTGLGYGYARHMWRRRSGAAGGPSFPGAPSWAARLPLIELKPRAIAQDLGGVLTLNLTERAQQRLIKVGQGGGDVAGDFQLQATFLVPEPASMIALGSGLVGLLALRRRKK